ncbi:hypothetical protein ZOSMA_71G00170 [Zostera marina]|uniref:Transposase (putative) gypsy type domain-containing protein n=1 Tax=Zostera marina TaxID=29655 RepID=A0A0K9NQQ9_ZOSMR|nr:hypothetical protein ZOSMA_71G00170 [Zostera marina]
MANHAFIEAIDLDGIPSRRNPPSSSTSAKIHSCWSVLLNGRPISTNELILYPLRRTTTSPPDGYTALYIAYSDMKMSIPASLFVLEVLRYTGVALYQLPPFSLDKVLTFKELCHSLGCGVPTIVVFRVFFAYAWKDERVTISARLERCLFGA